MAKFVYIYSSSADMDEANSTDAWMTWFGKLGDKVVDHGNPFNDGGQAVYSGGVMPVEGKPATGYSIVTAVDMAEATELAKSCPLVTSGGGAVCVYEALPM